MNLRFARSSAARNPSRLDEQKGEAVKSRGCGKANVLGRRRQALSSVSARTLIGRSRCAFANLAAGRAFLRVSRAAHMPMRAVRWVSCCASSGGNWQTTHMIASEERVRACPVARHRTREGVFRPKREGLFFATAQRRHLLCLWLRVGRAAIWPSRKSGLAAQKRSSTTWNEEE